MPSNPVVRSGSSQNVTGLSPTLRLAGARSTIRSVSGILVRSASNALLVPCFHNPKRPLRYYQEIAIHRAVEAILSGLPISDARLEADPSAELTADEAQQG